MPEDFNPEALLLAFGRATMRALAMTELSERQQRTILEQAAELDKLRYENHILKEARGAEVDAVRFQKAETVTVPVAEELEPQIVRLVKPKQ
jgi:hypothetical protein